jgi:hypothetical protein
MIWVVVVLAVLFYFIEGRSLLKNGSWKELALTAVMFCIALGYALDVSLERHFMPDPRAWLAVLHPAGDAFRSYLHIN